jgi:uncharacterized membrane protein YedE/YeeE
METAHGSHAKWWWNPYLTGAGIGVLSWVAFMLVDKPLGMSTQISEIAGVVAMPIVGAEGVSANPYWAKNVPGWNYGTLFLIGTLLGAFVSSLWSGSFKFEVVPPVWRERFGNDSKVRLLVAFIGGVLTMYGARMAGGCTSGHGIK